MAPRDITNIAAEEPAAPAARRRLRGRRLRGARAPENERRRRADADADSVKSELRRRDDDDEVAALRAGRRADREALGRARDELEEMRRIYEADVRRHVERAETTRKENEGLRAEIEALTRDLDAEAIITEYGDVLKTRGSSPSSEYSSKLQSELCKAAHRVEVLSDQVKIVKRTCDEKIKRLEEEMAELVHEKGMREAHLMKELRALHDTRRIEVESHEEDQRTKQATIYDLEKKLEEALANDNHAKDFSSEEASGDMLMAMNAFKQQIDMLSHEKEAVECSLNQKLKRKDETIALLQEVNAANEKHLELLRGDIEKRESNEEMNEETEECHSKAPVGKKEETAAAITVFMGSLAKVTGSLEGDIQASLRRKRMLIGSLECDDDQMTALPDVVEWGSTRNLNGGARSLTRQPSLLSMTSEGA